MHCSPPAFRRTAWSRFPISPPAMWSSMPRLCLRRWRTFTAATKLSSSTMSAFARNLRLIFWLKPYGVFGQHTRIGFLLVGPWDREMDAMKTFLREQKLEDAVCVLGSVPHNVFLTLLSRSLAYIRTPVTDGICSSVLESLKLKVPVLAVDNGTRPA